MAQVDLLFQGIREANDHESALLDLLGQNNDIVLISVAFVRESGVIPLAKVLQRNSLHTTVFAGARNGITSAQGLLALLKTGIRVIVVDTGSISRIFHPKIYAVRRSERAYVILGSANLTRGGLNGNIEASSLISLDLTNKPDKDYFDILCSSLDTLPNRYPENTRHLTSKRDVNVLLHRGIIEDERIARPPRAVATTYGNRGDRVPLMRTYARLEEPKELKPPSRAMPRTRARGWILVWESKELAKRDLSVPIGRGTHATGSMLLKKGNMQGIDYQSYFREVVFEDLVWTPDPDPGLSHLYRASADFVIVVKGQNYGTMTLRLTHNSRTDSRAFEQLNAMTQIHWGNAISIVANRDLLGRVLRLYRRDDDHTVFRIDID